MADSVVRVLLDDVGLKASVVVASGVARELRGRHRLAPASASLLAQGLVGGALMASLQKDETRINLQLECDGPFRGFFVDAGANGELRGYVKNPDLDVELQQGAFQWRAALGNKGFISVLRDIGGEYYRSSVELTSMRLADDLNHYFATSDQVATRVAIDVARRGDEGLGVVAGVLLQALPDGDLHALAEQGATLEGRLAAWAASAVDTDEAPGLAAHLFPGRRVLLETPLRFACTCSRERAIDTLASLGAAEVQHIVDTMGSTAITCHFCGARHEISLPDLWAILERLGKPQHRN
jgi:molecular chaperone Hsp33